MVLYDVVSLLYRVSAYIFLRWIPSPVIAYIILTCFSIWVIGFAFTKKERYSSSFWGLISGSFNYYPKFSLLVNGIIITFVLDYILTAYLFYGLQDLSFVRVGYTNSTYAKLVMRYPGNQSISLSYKGIDFDDWEVIQLEQFSQETDFVGGIELTGLQALTEYEYYTSNNLTGSFKTLSDASSGSFTILSTSCMLHRFPYSILDNPLRIAGLEKLGSMIEMFAPDFILFLGDFIYIDLPFPLGFAASSYYQKYRQVYGSPSWPNSANLSWINVYDDHEIVNDYDRTKDRGDMFHHAINQAFHSYQHVGNPEPIMDFVYTFCHMGVDFFLLDTRRYRDDESAPDGPNKTMLGDRQKQQLLDWLSIPSPWKIVVSSCPFTKNWHGPDGALDTWGGYLTERNELLQAMHAAGGVVILSGDRHEFGATEFPKDGAESVYEFSTSPLSQFYLPIPTYETTDTDIKLAYIPKGNTKVAAITFNTTNQPSLNFSLIVEDRVTWTFSLNREVASN